MLARIIFGIFLILGAFVLPWWASFFAALIGLFYFDKLYESIVVGLIIDSLYGVEFEFYGMTFFVTIFMLVAYFLISKFRKNLLI